MDISEILESPGFWILGGGGTIAVLGGWIMSKRAGWDVLPAWQMIAMIITVLIASAFFGTRE